MFRYLHRPVFVLAAATAGVLAVRVFAQSGAAPRAWTIAQAPADLKPAIAQADVIIVAQHSALLRQLNREIADGGTAAALRACHLEATSQAFWVARQQGVATGRTSDRLRAPVNEPRPWARPIVTEYAGRRVADVDGFAVDLGDRVGVLRPIATTEVCEGCHGPEDRIRPDLRRVLAEQYPKDRAVGFRRGEIRGWYWAEVPKSAGRKP
jgi:hypothetical protein